MSNDNLSFNQRVIFAGLSRVTDDRMVIQSAYSYWMKNFSNEPFDAIEVVAQLVSYLGLNDNEKKTLMIALHAASNKLHDDLMPVPQIMEESAGQTETPARKVNEKQVETSSAHLIVTNQYLQQIVQHINKQNTQAFRELTDILIAEGVPGLSANLSSAIVGWAKNGMEQLALPADISQDSCKELAHQIYLLVSEVIGPIDADDIVNKVVATTEKLDAASRFNPRELL